MNTLLRLFSLLLSAQVSFSFLAGSSLPSKRAFGIRSAQRQRSPTSSASSLSMLFESVDIASLPSMLVSGKPLMPMNEFCSITSAVKFTDPTFRAQLLNDIAHGFDLVPFCRPANDLLHLAEVIGRLCYIESDYLPDRCIQPLEMLFQFFMLVSSLSGFLKNSGVLSLVLACTATTTFRDGRAYRSVFEKVGVSWLQYKAMLATRAVGWIEAKAGSVIATDQERNGSYAFWLYRGDVQVHDNASQMPRCVSDGLLGDRNLAECLLDWNNEACWLTENDSCSQTTLRAGNTGATLLRIDTSKLSMLLELDPQLGQSLQMLLIKGMEDKLSTLMTGSSPAMQSKSG